MKLVVDKMPETQHDCLFYHESKDLCILGQTWCELTFKGLKENCECPYLKVNEVETNE